MEEFGKNWSEFSEALNRISDEKKITYIWRKSILIHIFKNIGDNELWKLSGHQPNVSQHKAIYIRENP